MFNVNNLSIYLFIQFTIFVLYFVLLILVVSQNCIVLKEQTLVSITPFLNLAKFSPGQWHCTSG